MLNKDSQAKKAALISMKEHVKRADEKRKKEPNHVSVVTIDSLIKDGLKDEEGNILKIKGKQK